MQRIYKERSSSVKLTGTWKYFLDLKKNWTNIILYCLLIDYSFSGFIHKDFGNMVPNYYNTWRSSNLDVRLRSHILLIIMHKKKMLLMSYTSLSQRTIMIHMGDLLVKEGDYIVVLGSTYFLYIILASNW